MLSTFNYFTHLKYAKPELHFETVGQWITAF